MTHIYTEDLFWPARVKNFIKKILDRQSRGPQAVLNSLLRGLTGLGECFEINKKITSPIETACVISGVAVLKWAIKQKKAGRINKIIAGPNIVVHPDESEGVLKNILVDKIIVPSQWVKDFYISNAQELLGKVYVWSAGVSLPLLQETEKQYDFLLFFKEANSANLAICEYLNSQGYKTVIFVYGKFKQTDYFKTLLASKYMVYCSNSESQGLSMFEAWAYGVPTLVWDRGFMESGRYRWQGNTGAPYLSESTGMRFKDFEDFKTVLATFLNVSFSPRQWVEQNATHNIAAKKYLELVNL